MPPQSSTAGLRGITKNLFASGSSHLVNVLQQVALTPLFLHTWGVAGYGQWLTLSASVSYLGTLDFGIQTFVNQDLTVRYHRGDMAGFHLQQSTALRLLLGIVAAATLLATLTLFLPTEHLLRINSVPAAIIRGTLLALALQVLVSILFGFVTGQFMVLGRAHLGQHWSNARALLQIVAAIPCLLLHQTFLAVALAQLAALIVCALGALLHLRLLGPQIFPTLSLWDASLVPGILKPSGGFALIFSSNFLVYQAPVLILERTAGPLAVTLFSITRTIFSMTRNVMNALTQAIGPEVTTLYARQDWPRLVRLYDYSERLVFALIPIANIGTLFLCPLLLTLWLHKPQLFAPKIYLLTAAISIVMSAKEHKFQFQFSTNTHRELARFIFLTDLTLVAAWLLILPRFAVQGLLWVWLAAESAQLLYLIRLNTRFFAAHQHLSPTYPVRLGLISLAALVLTAITIPHIATLPLPEQTFTAAAAALILAAAAIPLFHLTPVFSALSQRLPVTGTVRTKRRPTPVTK